MTEELTRTEYKRRDVLWALICNDRMRRGRWTTTGEIHATMGSSPEWKVYTTWMLGLVRRGFAEQRGKRKQWRITPEGRAEVLRLEGIAPSAELVAEVEKRKAGVRP